MTDLCIGNQFQCTDLTAVGSRTGHLLSSVQEFLKSQVMVVMDGSSSGICHTFYRGSLHRAWFPNPQQSSVLHLHSETIKIIALSHSVHQGQNNNYILHPLVLHVNYLFDRNLHKWTWIVVLWVRWRLPPGIAGVSLARKTNSRPRGRIEVVWESGDFVHAASASQVPSLKGRMRTLAST